MTCIARGSRGGFTHLMQRAGRPFALRGIVEMGIGAVIAYNLNMGFQS